MKKEPKEKSKTLKEQLDEIDKKIHKNFKKKKLVPNKDKTKLA